MKNIFEAIPDDLTTEMFENLVENKKVKIERIISKGAAVISFADNSSISLKEGDYLNIKAHQKHKVTWTAADVETIWLAVHY